MDRLTKEKLKVYYGQLRPWTRHSLVLLVAGLTYFGIGYAYFTAVAPTADRYIALEVMLRLMSFSQWGIVFMVVGVLVIVSSRWPPILEKWGYSLLTGLSSAWASGYLLSIIFAEAPLSNITGFLIWSLMAFLWWAISGLMNPLAVSDGSR